MSGNESNNRRIRATNGEDVKVGRCALEGFADLLEELQQFQKLLWCGLRLVENGQQNADHERALLGFVLPD